MSSVFIGHDLQNENQIANKAKAFFFRLSRPMLLLACISSIPLSAAQNGSSHDIPEWAMGHIKIKEIGLGFDKFLRLCDEVYTNSGGIAVKGASSLLFAAPLGEGLVPDRPGIVLFLKDPSRIWPLEKAYILPLADAQAYRRRIEQTYPTEKEGNDTIATVLQTIGAPDLKLHFRLIEDYVLAAPDANSLDRLEAALPRLIGQPPIEAAELRIDVAALQKQWRARIQLQITLAEALINALVPRAMQEFTALKHLLLNSLDELDYALGELRFSTDRVQLKFRLVPKKETALAGYFSQMEALSPLLLDALNESSTAALALNVNRIWPERFVPGALIQKVFPPETAEEQNAFKLLDESLLALRNLLAGTSLIQFGPGTDRQMTLHASLLLKPEQVAAPILEQTMQRLVGIKAEKFRAFNFLGPTDPVPYKLEILPAFEVNGLTARQHRFVLQDDAEVLFSPELQRFAEHALDWPLRVASLQQQERLHIGFGAQGENSLRSALSQTAAQRGLAAAHKELLSTAGAHGTIAAATLLSTKSLYSILNTLGYPDKLLRRMESEALDEPLLLQLRASEGALSLQADASSGAISDLIVTIQALNRVGIRILPVPYRKSSALQQ